MEAIFSSETLIYLWISELLGVTVQNTFLFNVILSLIILSENHKLFTRTRKEINQYILKRLSYEWVMSKFIYLKKKNSMVRVRERTISTERPPLVGEVIANFFG
jgi:hypothetical protein